MAGRQQLLVLAKIGVESRNCELLRIGRVSSHATRSGSIAAATHNASRRQSEGRFVLSHEFRSLRPIHPRHLDIA